MAVRILSAVIGLPVLIFFLIMGGWYLRIATAVVSLVGMYELYMAVSKKIKPVHFVGFLAELYYVLCFGLMEQGINHIAILVAVMAMMVTQVAMHEKMNIHDLAVTVFGFLYVGMLLYCIVLISNLNKVWVWLPFICAWGSDTFAYFVGINFGKHRLAPVLSPKKSVEGAVGGAVGAGLLVVLYCYICNKLNYFNYENIGTMLVVFFLFGVIAAAFSQVGDLAASAIKRYTGIKDYGKIMPGHGGVLDRFDSVLLTAPSIYILVYLLERF